MSPILPAASLPFVTRALRGGRGRRFAFFGGLVALINLFLGFWLALGHGPFEQGLRVGLGLERDEWMREHEEFVVVVHSEQERRTMSNEAFLENAQTDARVFARAAVRTPTPDLHQQALQARAADLLARRAGPSAEPWETTFAWQDERSVRRLQAIVAQEFRPEIVRYRSPLGVGDGFALLGFLSGTALVGLLFVLAPLMVGSQQAQEVHENTLQPLTGTAMGTRELVLGLASGPLAITALFAGPQAILYLVAGAARGSTFAAAAFLGVCLVSCATLCVIAQLAGHLAGRRRSPGVVGATLLTVLGMAAAIGAGAGLNLAPEAQTLLTMFPQASAFYLLHEAFAPTPLLTGWPAAMAGTSIAAGVLGLGILGFLLLLVVERRVSGREGPALSAGEALLGAVTAIVSTMMTVPYWDDPWSTSADAIFYYMTLALLSPGLVLLVASRVPLGELPPSMRRVSLRRLAGEVGVVLALHLGAVLWMAREPSEIGIFHPVALAYLAWAIGVLVLVCVRIVAVPMGIGGGVWAAFSLLGVAVAFGHAAVWGSDTGSLTIEHVFALGQLSPLLGLLQVGLTVWIPIALVRILRRNLAAI
jgi:hypothetical protein